MDHSFTDGILLAVVIFGLLLGMAGLEALVSGIQEHRKIRRRVQAITKRRLQ
jgi:L-cystine uptake protein TcyP (sodium:dicarboxylate symporter family)